VDVAGRALRVAAAVLVLGLTVGSAPAIAAPGAPKITFYLGLKRPEARAAAAFYAVSRPGSRSYRRFLSLRQVSARYGASGRVRRAFLKSVAAQGLTARIDPSGVFARVRGTAAQLSAVFRVHINTGISNEPNVRFWNVRGNRLHLPAAMRPLVRDVVPDYTQSLPASAVSAQTLGAAVAHAAMNGGARDHVNVATAARQRAPRRSGTWIQGCAKAKRTGGFSFAQARGAYGVNRLGNGAGASVAILQLAEGVSAADISDNARCFGYPRLRARTLIADGQSAPITQGLFEPQEDLALVRGMAPKLTSITFTQTWTTAGQWFLGVSKVLDAPRRPDSLSISYGLCERSVRGRHAPADSRAGANLLDSLLLRLGLTGTGSYASAGDSGSSCNGTRLAGVAWPGSSPFVTAVGGTQLSLNRANQRSGEVVWNDLRYESINAGGGAGGGGFTVASERPPFQRGLGLPGNHRTTPDVSAAASAFPGWPVVLNGNWETDAGTSGAAPLVASAMAILSARQRQLHRPPVGPADGLFYYLRRNAPSTFFDVVKGNNGYFRKVRAHYAKPGYDLASGLGVPQFGRLASALPRPGR
jgi:kumamolisin